MQLDFESLHDGVVLKCLLREENAALAANYCESELMSDF
jgi:hypothetical protein